MVTLDLTILDSNTGVDTQIHCDTYTWIDGVTYTSSSNNTATWTLTNAAGCDSVVTLDLTINSSVQNINNFYECGSYTHVIDGVTYIFFDNNVFIDTLNTVNGCDSIVITNYEVGQSNNFTTTTIACDSYLWSGDGNIYSATGI